MNSGNLCNRIMIVPRGENAGWFTIPIRHRHGYGIHVTWLWISRRNGKIFK
jgi:hypothetical protein